MIKGFKPHLTLKGAPAIAVLGTAFLALAACQSSGGGGSGLGALEGNCRMQAANNFSVTTANISLNAPTKSADGGTIISGTADQGDLEIRNFQCAYDAGGNLLQVSEI